MAGEWGATEPLAGGESRIVPREGTECFGKGHSRGSKRRGQLGQLGFTRTWAVGTWCGWERRPAWCRYKVWRQSCLSRAVCSPVYSPALEVIVPQPSLVTKKSPPSLPSLPPLPRCTLTQVPPRSRFIQSSGANGPLCSQFRNMGKLQSLTGPQHPRLCQG